MVRKNKEGLLRHYLRKLGKQPEEAELVIRTTKKKVLWIEFLLLVFIAIKAVLYHSIQYFLIYGVLALTIGLIAVYLLTWLIVFIWIDLKLFKRKTMVEEVFPDFLMLVASNINAGMTIDRAIMLASRSKFGPLAEDIEEITKKSLAGKDIEECLKDFANKYDSPLIKRSIALIIKGIESGGQISDLLNRIAIDIQENRILRKEMAANVTTYAIFISSATMFGAPLLFALATQLIKVVNQILSNVDLSELQTGGSLTINISSNVLNIHDFYIYVYVLLIGMSIVSSAIISSIKYGSVKKGWKTIPFFVLTTIIIYLLSNLLLGKIFAGLI